MAPPGPPREIPGMYFDAAKNKYFAIPKSGAVPLTHPYSKDNVKKRKMEDEAAEIQKRVVDLNKNRIKRTPFQPLPYDGLHRDLGQDRIWANPLRHYASELEYDRVHCRNGKVTYRFPMTPGYGGLSRPLDVSKRRGYGSFDVSHKYGSILYDGDWPSSTIFCSDLDRRKKITNEDKPLLQFPQIVYRGDGDSPIQSINIHHQTGLVLTTWQTADRGHNCFTTKIEGRSLFTPGSAQQWRLQSGRGVEAKYEINAVAVGPSSNKYAFMIGGNFGYICCVDHHGNFDRLFPLAPRPEYETFAIEMAQDDPDIFLMGRRSGHIDVVDLREPNATQTPHNGVLKSAATIQHAASICKIKDMGDKKFVVSGLQDTMSVYDLRWIKNRTKFLDRIPNANAPPNTRRFDRQKNSIEFTYPVVWMPEHKNHLCRTADVAVDRSTGLIAAAQNDGRTNPIALFNMHTGEKVYTLHIGHEDDNTSMSHQIRWLPDNQTGANALKSLWVSKGEALYSCRWGGGQDAKNSKYDEVVETAAF